MEDSLLLYGFSKSRVRFLGNSGIDIVSSKKLTSWNKFTSTCGSIDFLSLQLDVVEGRKQIFLYLLYGFISFCSFPPSSSWP